MSFAGDDAVLVIDGVHLTHPPGARLGVQAEGGRADVVVEPRKDARVTVSWGPLDKTTYKTLDSFAEGAVKGLRSKLRRCQVSERHETFVNGHPTVEQRLDEATRGLHADRHALTVNFFCPESRRYFGLLLLAREEAFPAAHEDFRSTVASIRCHD